MQIPVIKKLVETYNASQLQQAEADLLEERPLQIEVEGEDEGEQLTHVMAALWVQEEQQRSGDPIGKCVRKYTQKVRNSIS
ncbi:MAG: hypothetical protein F6K11_10275 [Leptolyngbya sp. SIO3F4]|nr:hypothetical protein [Leptolyngbya sp. SIO3F4]